MDYKKIKATHDAVTRDLTNFDKETGNIYETVVNLSKRANQISSALCQELVNKIADFSAQNTGGDGIDEIYENREQIEIARYYEQLSKPTLIATQELLDGTLKFRRANSEPAENTAL
ncbi:MAG: DNA-directed RNA polymerase subunit omega [Bacteroides sp.]|nr:DNA-directed RNA polymerase subunit omega [Bacteroides sp.]